MSSIWAALSRRKTLEPAGGVEGGSQLARVLSVVDLTALGVGSTLGLGVYALAGVVARNNAGPAVCISFLIAAIASAMAGSCYAEFASRVPKAGSAYIYSYVSVGEFIAYIIGWNLILEYVIGTASVARGVSGYIDALAGNAMQNGLRKVFPMDVDFISDYPDFFSLFIVLLLAAILSFGVKESTCLNNLFTALNLITVAIVLVAGSIKADVHNWNIKKDEIPANFTATAGNGGFMPFGFAGVMAGAAKCFYGFVGFDCIATTGEEAKNPKKSIPLSIVISLIIIFLAYFGISTVLTLMWPYYDQDPAAPFPYVFEQVGWPVIKWIVTIGAIFALTTSLLGAMFPLPRILYAMALDGLIFEWFAKVNASSQTPVIATIVSGIFAGLMAVFFKLDQLIDMMSIGTLLAYTIVAICVLLLRYRDEEPIKCPTLDYKNPLGAEKTMMGQFKQVFNLNGIKHPHDSSSTIVNWGTVVFTILSIILCALISEGIKSILDGEAGIIVATALVVTAMILTMIAIGRQPTGELDIAFQVPLVPLVPCLSIICNIYLMLQLDVQTWIRFVVWLAIGFAIYFFYGIRNSKEKQIRKEQKEREMRKFNEITMTKF